VRHQRRERTGGVAVSRQGWYEGERTAAVGAGDGPGELGGAARPDGRPDVRVHPRARRDEGGVRDGGPGLTPGQQDGLWDRFRRVHDATAETAARDAGGGLGLGLYISRMLIERHGGKVGVESSPGAGSTFWFALPLS